MARKFMFVCVGILALTVAFLLGAQIGRAEYVDHSTTCFEAARSETLAIDSRFGSASTSEILPEGEWFRVTVSGTYSAWFAWQWSSPCGAPEPQPMIPSPGIQNGPVGTDAEVWFAAAYCDPGDTLCCCNVPCPRHHPYFQMNTAGEWLHVEPRGGPYATPLPGHTYEYTIQGRGQRASFRIYDSQYVDNYGVVLVTVAPDASSLVPPVEPRGCLYAAPSILTSFTQIRFDRSEQPMVLVITDVRGSEVLSIPVARGVTGVSWSGRDALDRPVRSGVYWAVLIAGDRHACTKIVVVR
jgi:hypothetical protein